MREQYALARARAEQAEGNTCLIVHKDGLWEVMTWGEFLASNITHRRVGWLKSNTQVMNERWFKLANKWLEDRS